MRNESAMEDAEHFDDVWYPEEPYDIFRITEWILAG